MTLLTNKQRCHVKKDTEIRLYLHVKADALTSQLRIGRPSETNSKEQQSMNAGEQTPTNLRQDQLTPPPTHTCRLPNAGGLCGSFPEGHFR